MKMEQVYQILNTITNEILGETVIVNEDLSNVVDIGKAFQNLDGAVDRYVRRLQDHIGKVVFVDRVYSGRYPSVLRDAWEYGSICEKIRADLPEATENESWELVDGASYDPNIFTAPKISVKFFNNKVTFEIPISITRQQVTSSFSSAVQLNAFYSMIATAVENSMTIKLDSLIERTVNSAIGETIHSEFPGGTYTNASGVRAVNLFYLYKQAYPNATETADTAIYSPDFIRFAVYTIKNYFRWVASPSNLFNIGGTTKFTPVDRQHIAILGAFKNAADVYLYDGNGQFNTSRITLPENIDEVPYWQGSGLNMAFDDISTINIKTPSGDTVNVSGILAVLFDRDTLGVANLNRRVTTDYNPKAEFYNEWHKADAGYWLDLDENCIVFFVA